MHKGFGKILNSKFWWLWLLLLLAGINYLASDFHAKLDLTKEKRYTLSKATKDLLRKLDDDVQIDVFLKGEFPAGFRKLANSTNDFLRLLEDRNGKIHYRFISPEESVPGARISYGDSLINMGAIPINLTVQKEAGKSSNIIFPVVMISYKGNSTLVNLYTEATSRISQTEINSAEALMEYQFAKALDKLTNPGVPIIAYATGNGEPLDGRIEDLGETLSKEYRFFTFDLKKQPVLPKQGVDVLLIVKPTEPFTEEEKLKIDQFVMQGGKLLCFIDNLYAEQDSLAFKPETIAFDRNLNLTDLFFRYGLRINTDLVMDLQCDLIPMVVGGTQDNPQIEYLHWNYFPLLNPGNSSFVKNLGYVRSRFANSIDTIQVNGVSKTPLLVSSPNSRIISTPAIISLNENKNVPEDEKFKRNAIPVGMLLEGQFTSLYKNRASQVQRDSLAAHGINFSDRSVDNKMIVVADGDIVFNEFIPSQQAGQPPLPLPMGWNKYTYTEYMKQSDIGKLFVPVSNREFLLNCVEYLVSNPAIAETRNKEIVLRLLDSKKIKAQKTTWQFVNIALPVLLVILFGFIYQQIRKRKYS